MKQVNIKNRNENVIIKEEKIMQILKLKKKNNGNQNKHIIKTRRNNIHRRKSQKAYEKRK